MTMTVMIIKSNRGITPRLLILMEMKRKLVTLDKVFLQTSLKRNILISSYIFLLNVNFENLTDELYVLYVLIVHVKFCSNQMLFTIRSISLCLVHNFLPKT